MADAVYMVPVYEKDLKAVLRFLVERNPEEIENVAPKAPVLAAPKVETQEEAEAEKRSEGATNKRKWSDQKLDEYDGKCKPVQRAILDRIAETSEKGIPCRVYDEVFNAAKAAYDGDGEFGPSTLQGNFAWLTKYSNMVIGGDDGDWATTKSLMKGDKGDIW